MCIRDSSFLCGGVIGAGLVVSAHTWLPGAVYPLFHLSPASAEIATLILTFVGCLMPLRSFDTTNTVGVLLSLIHICISKERGYLLDFVCQKVRISPVRRGWKKPGSAPERS